MDPFEKEELSDAELNLMLSAWKVSGGPRPMSIQPAAPWWRRSISVPWPLAAAVLVAMVYGLVRLTAPAPVVIQWRPVDEIKVRIIRSGNVKN